MKKNRMFFGCVVVVIILGIMLVVRQYQVINLQFPRAISKEATPGEQLELQKGVMISVKESGFFSDKENELYLNKMPGADYFPNMKLFEVTVILENESDKVQKVNLEYMHLETLGVGTAICYEMYDLQGKEYSAQTNIEILPGEFKELTYPYMILPWFYEKDWKEIEQRQFWLTISSYPERKRLLL